MPGLASNIERYSKFFSFMLKYWNSQIFKTAADNAMDTLDESKDENEKAYDQKPEELVEDLKRMGPTFIKLGQLLSTRPDLLPDEYLQELAKLQDDVDPLPYEEIHKLVEEELGIRISKAFRHFEQEPLASASIGQVHKAMLNSGKVVAVKIQRPGVRTRFLEDLDALKEMVGLAVKYTKTARQYALDDILDELRHMLLNELDYHREAHNLVILGENLRKYEHLVIPQPVNDYSTSRILTMDYIEGTKITKLSPLKKMESDFTPLIDDLVESYLQQVVVDGFAHADPHPGNVHLTPENRIALMDLGMVAKFSPTLQDNMLHLLMGISKNDGDDITDILLNISNYEPDVNLQEFRRDINRLVMDNQSRIASEMKTGRLLIQMNRIAADKGIKIAVELNLLGKILLNMDQIIAEMTPDYDFQDAIQRYVQNMMQSKMLGELKPENMFKMMLATKKFTENLPDRLNRITDKLANDSFSIKVEALDEKRLTDGFQKVANRITLGLIIAAMIVGAAMLMRVPTTFTLFGYPGLAMFFFIAAAFIGFILIYNILSNDETFRRKKK